MIKRLVLTGLALAGVVGAWPASGRAQEASAVYEDWTARMMRSDRWLGMDTGLADVKREVTGHTFVMRTRREGTTASDVGFTTGRHRLIFNNPVAIDQISATLKIRDLAIAGCTTNPQQPSRVLISVVLNKFNDGSGGPGNLTGDHNVTVQAYRESTSLDAEGMVRFRAFVGRCIDATCSNAFSIPGGVVDLPGAALVGEPFALRAVWDSPNNQFLVGAAEHPNVAIAYPAQANQKPAGGAFADIRTLQVTANCTPGPSVADTTLNVEEVQTNASAIIP